MAPSGKTLVLSACLAAATAAAAGKERAENAALRNAIEKTRADIERAVEELNALRATAQTERRPLAGRLESLRDDVADMRRRAERSRLLRRQGEQEYRAQAERNGALTETCRFVSSLLSEYRRSLETRAGRAETVLLKDRLAEVDSVLGRHDSFESLPDAGALLLETAEFWNGKKAGGMIIGGSAIDGAGVEHAGKFAVAGPAVYFHADDGTIAGPVVARLGSAMPAVYGGFTDEEKRRIALLVAGREPLVPVDVTSGDALKVAQAKPSLSEHVRKGGFVMIPLLATGILALFLVLWKIVELGRVGVGPSADLDAVMRALKEGDAARAANEAGRLKQPLRSIVLEGIEHRDAPIEHIEEIMEERVLTCVPGLERHLGLLAVLGGVAPLLGLLGTVTGMIHTFQLVTVFGAGDARLLSSGISEALVTTEFGLAIAIPVLLAHALLSRRVRTLVERLETTAARFTEDLKPGKEK